MISDPRLWDRIEKYKIDDEENNLKFSDRLKRENGWSDIFTTRVIDEYKCFLYLACVGGHEVTPSEEVDQVWHLHLIYSHSYWSELCGEVLQRPLHHGPTKGGQTEDARYAESYAATLSSYQREFEAKPPSDIWPSLDLRFQNAGQIRFVDTRKNWVVRKASVLLALKLFFSVALISAIPSCVQMSSPDSSATGAFFSWLTWMGITSFIGAFLGLIAWSLEPNELERAKAQKEANQKKDGSDSSAMMISIGCGGGSSGGGSSGGSGCGGGGCGSS